MYRIPLERIGRFENLLEAKAYQKAMAIVEKAEEAAKQLKAFDESEWDYNDASPGFVLVDQVSLEGGKTISGFYHSDDHGDPSKFRVKLQSEGSGSSRTFSLESTEDYKVFRSPVGAVRTEQGYLVYDSQDKTDPELW